MKKFVIELIGSTIMLGLFICLLPLHIEANKTGQVIFDIFALIWWSICVLNYATTIVWKLSKKDN